MTTKENLELFQFFEMDFFCQFFSSCRGELRILPNICDVFLYTMAKLNNLIKVFVYFDVSIALMGAFIDVFFSANISNKMSLIVISVNASDVGNRTAKDETFLQ